MPDAEQNSVTPSLRFPAESFLPMGIFRRLRTLVHLTLVPVRGETHQQRLDSFYRAQAADYDAFRAKMLHGRDELFAALPLAEGDVWVDLGAGTGENATRVGDRLKTLKKVYQVDLSTALQEQAKQRIEREGWKNVETVYADATTFTPPEGQADVVTFSYSLTMIPDWFAAIQNALRILRPGGTIGVVDFYVSRKHPAEGLKRHGWFSRTFWPVWYAINNVFVGYEHLPYLHHFFETVQTVEARGKVPHVPFLKTPYFWFIGRKKG